MSDRQHVHDPDGTRSTAPELFGARLAALRMGRGWSQLRLAEQLCAAAGVPTVSRHEISRWERGERVPGEFWLGWLAVVLDTPHPELVAAAALARRGPARRATRGSSASGQAELLRLARAWLVDPARWPGPADRWPATDPHGPAARLAAVAAGLARGLAATGAPARGPAETPIEAPTETATSTEPGVGAPSRCGTADDLGAAVAELRRLDDLVGGADLAGPAGRRLDGALAATVEPGTAPAARRGLLALVAEAAQLTGWVAADAGDAAGALSAYRIALVAAGAAGDRPLAAHVLGSASHLLAAEGESGDALLLARTALAGARRGASATLRALLLHRLAIAAAGCGERRLAHAALAAAETAALRRDPRHDPPWLYWLGDAELSALAGRCLAALGRPLRAEPLLTTALTNATGPRSAAVYGAWLARACLDLGEVERACEVAGGALLDAVRSGSARATAEIDRIRVPLAAHRHVPEAREYTELVAACRPYLARAVIGTTLAGKEVNV
ncbi:helix-turn-helix domain-containing protein [Micromonospora sp. CPCC 206061]|uniref:helix-turn-helix domain-containing protein n=1 Tax=Micromonospora sp. CPCC 206061 TaxID=3122410 RepID=UPI002FF12331